MENKSEPYISVIYQLLVLAIGSPMPARAIKLLRDPRWRATPLYTPLSQAGKKTCFVSELLNSGAAVHMPREGAGPDSGGQDWKGGKGGGRGTERELREGLWDTFKGSP